MLNNREKRKLLRAFAKALYSNEVKDLSVEHEREFWPDDYGGLMVSPTGTLKISFRLIPPTTVWLDMVNDHIARKIEEGR